jgi:hypothetical protein
MGNKKDIGKAYKNKLEGYDVTPHNRVWENIEAELKKNNRKPFPFWITLTGIGILIILSSLLIYNKNIDTKPAAINPKITNTSESSVKNNSNNNQLKSIDSILITQKNLNTNQTKNKNSAFDTIKNNQNNTSRNSKLNKLNLISKNKSTTDNKATNNNKYSNPNSISTKSKDNIVNSSKSISDNDSIRKYGIKNSLTNLIESNQTQNSLNDSIYILQKPVVLFKIDDFALLELDLELEEEKEETKLKPKKIDKPFVLTAYITPTYSSPITKGSSIDKDLTENKKVGGINLNYGLSTTLVISEKASVRLGLGINKISYTTKNADSTASNGFLINSHNFSHLDLDNQAASTIPNVFSPLTTLDLKQKLKYLEIPVEYSYQIFKKDKLKIHLLGGLSGLFLLDDSIIAKDNNGNSLTIGKANNIREFTFSFNISSKASYEFSKKLFLNAEPSFKYHSGIFRNNGNFNFFSFGVRIGLTYKF